MRLLIIEDDHDLAANLCDFCERKGWTVDVAMNGRLGLELASSADFDAVILDLGLPFLDGLDVCSRLRREAGRSTPVLMLTARDTIDDKLEGFDAGADDYLVKPFDLRELEARLRALLRRRHPPGPRVLTVADLTYDLETAEVHRAGQPVKVGPIGRKILEVLMRETHRVVARREIEQAVWGDSPPDSDALRSHIHSLRSAIDRSHARPLVQTVHGLGYRLH